MKDKAKTFISVWRLVCSDQPKLIRVIKRLCIKLSFKGRTINIKREKEKDDGNNIIPDKHRRKTNNIIIVNSDNANHIQH